jgi:hypothetical protein
MWEDVFLDSMAKAGWSREYRNKDSLGHFMRIGPDAQRTADVVIDWLKRKRE